MYNLSGGVVKNKYSVHVKIQRSVETGQQIHLAEGRGRQSFNGGPYGGVCSRFG